RGELGAEEARAGEAHAEGCAEGAEELRWLRAEQKLFAARTRPAGPGDAWEGIEGRGGPGRGGGGGRGGGRGGGGAGGGGRGGGGASPPRGRRSSCGCTGPCTSRSTTRARRRRRR